MSQNAKYFVYGIMGLAALGLFYNLIVNPVSFFKSIFMMLGFALVIGIVLYYFLIGRRRTGQNANYRKALKQSRKKYGRNTVPFSKPNEASKIQRTNRKATHLTVIKGNKK
ncbi:SA1362 family protein [Piscibacillus halophilus]|uniref:SA1362 family protein n=1 Tax=Piscibacillus halophilus TaxID=571933 RepID=UPI00240A4C56|nr:SA1362 family protein [Piscibacillus halophilus]